MSQPTSSTTAPWKPLFAQHLQKLAAEAGSPEFCLATVTADGRPQVRYCIHRGFWASLPENPHNKLRKNPDVFESDCPTFTTDARMSKTYDIFATGKGKGTLEQSQSGCGGGGPVEAVYWVKSVMTQWRIKGRCWLVAADDVEGGEESAQNSGTVSMKAAVGRYMRETGMGSSDWSWKLEVENHFENLSPTMKGSFKNPPPGRPINGESKGPGEALGQKAGRLSEEDLARKNFRVAIITPESVEQVDLSDPAESKRWIWTLAEEHGGPRGDRSGPGGAVNQKAVGEWNMVETWP